jgi:hypothetical protein
VVSTKVFNYTHKKGYMKKALVFVVLLFFLSSQVTGVVLNENPNTPYMVCHFDNHREAYIYWRMAREKGLIDNNMILVHFDAHHDMDCMVEDRYTQWQSTYNLGPEEVKGFTNGTFIDSAINEGLVSEIWWVIPDYMYWGEHYDQLETFISGGEPRKFYKYVRFCDCEKTDHVECTLMDIHDVSPLLPLVERYTITNARVHFVTVDMLPRFDKEILLDIDTDYFINKADIDRYPEYFDENDLRPWISVRKVVNTVINLRIKTRVVTVAISPAYTHEKYHYLAWEIARSLEEYLSGMYPQYQERFLVV